MYKDSNTEIYHTRIKMFNEVRFSHSTYFFENICFSMQKWTQKPLSKPKDVRNEPFPRSLWLFKAKARQLCGSCKT